VLLLERRDCEVAPKERSIGGLACPEHASWDKRHPPHPGIVRFMQGEGWILASRLPSAARYEHPSVPPSVAHSCEARQNLPICKEGSYQDSVLLAHSCM
jgi:hypothetical protein